jgi:acetyl esterase/lipase
LILNLHGGGWYTGDKTLATLCCAELAARGHVVMNANYSIAAVDPVPAMVADALAALRWAHGTATPDQVRAAAARGVVLAGDSAGAHIAALTCVALRDARLADLLDVDTGTIPPVVGLISWCGALSLDSLLVDRGDPLFDRFAVYLQALTGGHRVAERLAELDPRRWLAAGMPPTLVVTSAADFLEPSGRAFAQASQAAGLPVTLVDYDDSHPSCVHSWQLDPSLAESQEVYDLVTDFVRTCPSP